MNLDTVSTHIGRDLGAVVGIEPMADDQLAARLDDATSKYVVRMADGPNLFLIVSGAGNRHLVGRAVANIGAARAAVSPATARHILDPVAAGVAADGAGGTSYAAWTRQQAFPTAGRLQRFLARRRHAGPILDWAEGLVRDTLAEGDAGAFAAGLRRVERERGFAPAMREDAARARARLEAGAWRPRHCLQHGDLWLGNVVLSEGPEGPSFYVVDWAGMERDGYPFYDLGRMLMSLRAPPRMARERVARLCGLVGCAPADAIAYALAGLGHLGRHLECFPPDLWRSMGAELHGVIRGASA